MPRLSCRLPRPARLAALLLVLVLSACGAAAKPIVPTEIPTATVTLTVAPSRTPDRDVEPTATATAPLTTPTGGPSPTPLFGPTRAAAVATPTRPPNPNAPRIEFFTTNVLGVAPGEAVTLFWSIRNVTEATIYRVERDGTRSRLWKVPSDGRLDVQTRRVDRDTIDFLLAAGEGEQRVEQALSLPLSCPDGWFFRPAPESCPRNPPEETRLRAQDFERGRLLFDEAGDRIYALFNDGQQPAWIALDNRYDPAVHPETEPGFVPPPGYVQPLRALGFVWRGNDVVRGRLGLGLAPEATYDGYVQTASDAEGRDTVYASGADGAVLELAPGGQAWHIITPP